MKSDPSTLVLSRQLATEGYLILVEAQSLDSPTSIRLVDEETAQETNISMSAPYHTDTSLNKAVRKLYRDFQKAKSIEQRKAYNPISYFDFLMCIKVREVDIHNPYQIFLREHGEAPGTPVLTWRDEKYVNPVHLHINSNVDKAREAGWCMRLTRYPDNGRSDIGFAKRNDPLAISDLAHKMLTPVEDLQISFALEYPDIAAKAAMAVKDKNLYWFGDDLRVFDPTPAL